jgi:hypothetical protein
VLKMRSCLKMVSQCAETCPGLCEVTAYCVVTLFVS